MSDQNTSENSVRLAAREIPPPVTISLAARKALSDFAATQFNPYPDPSDIGSWLKIMQERERRWEPWVSRTLADTKCIIETRRLGGVTVYISTPFKEVDGLRGCVYLYIHGGAFVFGGGRFAMAFGARTADQLGVTTFAVDYRMPPKYPFPAALDDCFLTYCQLIKEYSPSKIVVGGGSSGGNLASALLLMLRDKGVPLPAAAALLTPLVDLTESGDSFCTNEDVDVVLKRRLSECIALYAAGQDLRDPYLSPLFANFEQGFVPTFIQSGTRDLLLSSAVQMHRRLRSSGICADLNIWEAMPHGGFGFDPGVPENEEVNAELVKFMELYCRKAVSGAKNVFHSE